MRMNRTTIYQLPSRSQLLAGVRKLEKMLQAAETIKDADRITKYFRVLFDGLHHKGLTEDAHYVWRIVRIKIKQLTPELETPCKAPSGAVIELKLKEIT